MKRLKKLLVLFADLFLLSIITAAIVPACVVLIVTRKRNVSDSKDLKLFVVFVAHSYGSIRTYGHEQLILQQGLGSFFKKVYTFYPFLGSNPFDKISVPDGNIREYALDEQNVFLEVHQSFIRFLSRFPRSNFLLSQWITLLRTKRFILDNRISIIRGSEPFLTGSYSYLLSRLTGRPFALRIGANFDLLYENGLFAYQKIFKWHFVEKAIARFVFSHADLVCAATQNYLEYVLANDCSREKAVLVRFGNIIDPVHVADPKARPPITHSCEFLGKPFGVYVGRLTKIKHVDHLIYVAAEVKKVYPTIVVVLIGDGDIVETMKHEVARLGVENNILFLGKQKQEFIASLLPHATAYLAPHSGKALVEAAYAGIPLIAYNWEWHAELVQHRITGELVTFKDWHAMAESFCRILSDPLYAKRLGDNARTVVLEMMDQKKIQALERAKYLEVLEGNNRNRGF